MNGRYAVLAPNSGHSLWSDIAANRRKFIKRLLSDDRQKGFYDRASTRSAS